MRCLRTGGVHIRRLPSRRKSYCSYVPRESAYVTTMSLTPLIAKSRCNGCIEATLWQAAGSAPRTSVKLCCIWLPSFISALASQPEKENNGFCWLLLFFTLPCELTSRLDLNWFWAAFIRLGESRKGCNLRPCESIYLWLIMHPSQFLYTTVQTWTCFFPGVFIFMNSFWETFLQPLQHLCSLLLLVQSGFASCSYIYGNGMFERPTSQSPVLHPSTVELQAAYEATSKTQGYAYHRPLS